MIKKILQIIFIVLLAAGITAMSALLISKRADFFPKKNIQLNFNKIIFNNSQNPAAPTTAENTIQEVKAERKKPAEKKIRGLYITAYTASETKKIDEILNKIKGTTINALVIDIKTNSGSVAYDSQLAQVNSLGTKTIIIKDIAALIQKLHENGIYTIARLPVFQDLDLAQKKPAWAIQKAGTSAIWKDKKGLGWIDPTVKEAWQYNIDIAKEAIDLGFDEVNFDYIRFPSDGNLKSMEFHDLAGRTKREVMRSFFEYLHQELKDKPAYTSVDFFGLTSVREDDMNIGQNIENAAPNFDYICPMVYPSHYPVSYLNFKNPADHPYEIISHDLTIANARLAKLANSHGKIRPWLQAFNMGAVYTPAMIDLEIKAQKDSASYGYLLWNAGNIYNYLPAENLDKTDKTE